MASTIPDSQALRLVKGQHCWDNFTEVDQRLTLKGLMLLYSQHQRLEDPRLYFPTSPKAKNTQKKPLGSRISASECRSIVLSSSRSETFASRVVPVQQKLKTQHQGLEFPCWHFQRCQTLIKNLADCKEILPVWRVYTGVNPQLCSFLACIKGVEANQHMRQPTWSYLLFYRAFILWY